jgi:hypothetical protein
MHTLLVQFIRWLHADQQQQAHPSQLNLDKLFSSAPIAAAALRLPQRPTLPATCITTYYTTITTT